MIKTGIYRIRKGWFGRCILQEYMNHPSLVGGQVDASIRDCYWEDVNYNRAPTTLKIGMQTAARKS